MARMAHTQQDVSSSVSLNRKDQVNSPSCALQAKRALLSGMSDQRYISAGHRQTAGGGKGKAECCGVPASQGSELTFGGEHLSPTRLPPSWIPERHYLPGHLVVFAPSFPVAFQELLGKADEAELGPTQYLLAFLGRAPRFHHCACSGLTQTYIHALHAMPVLLSGRKTGMSRSQADPMPSAVSSLHHALPPRSSPTLVVLRIL